jgi:hypothetical protein
MRVPVLPEKLVAGRQADYFDYFFNIGKFTPSDVAHFVKAYANLAQLQAAFEMYRAFPANANSTLRNAGQMTCRYSWLPETRHRFHNWFPR